MKSFKAAVLVKLNSPLEIIDLRFPVLQENQILVRNIYSGICRSQLMEIQGKRGFDNWIPHLLGHEGYGIVEEIGNSVKKFKKDDKVILSWIKGYGTQSTNPNYLSLEGKKVNSGKISTFSEYTVTSECFLAKVPVGFDEKVLPFFGCAFLTGAGMAIRNITKQHRKIAILGFGGVGSSAALALASRIGLDIHIIEESEEKRVLAKNLGFEKIISKKAAENLVDYFDLCIESAGSIESIELGFKIISTKGKMIFASHPDSEKKITIDPYDLIKGKQIQGSWGGGSHLDEDISHVAKLFLESGRNMELLVGQMFNLQDINDAFVYLAKGLSGRPVLCM
jgi:S-(hydroxymethyl)glutathione dehydrogenase/alcohol dehydrogenase